MKRGEPLSGPASPAKSEVRSEFDAKADTYESDRLGRWYQAQGRIVLRHVGSLEGSVLDVGCGTGWLLRALVEEHPDTSAIGVDLSEGMIRVARSCTEEQGGSRIDFMVGDWETDSTQRAIRERIPDGATLVVCVSTFHYFERPLWSLEKMRETLAPGGRLLLLDRAMDRSVGTGVWDLLHRYLIRDHVKFFRTSEMITLLRDAGFADVKVAERISRLFWRGKLHTSLVLLSAGVEGH